MRNWPFAKGHGTHNDFVIVLDRHGMYNPDENDVRFLCDRHGGIGGDGLLRVVRAGHVAEWDGDPDIWFMDYRNADGSVAEICGNGIRVFARYLLEEGMVMGEEIPIGTRAGLRMTTVMGSEQYRVDMGRAHLSGDHVRVQLNDQEWPAIAVDVGNPHAVVVLESGADAELAELDLHYPPQWQPQEAFPDGANVEFITIIGDGRLRMRVFERGVGETQSCGTGTVAAAVAAAEHTGVRGRASRWQVEVSGGEVVVDVAADDTAQLTGPAVIVARGEVNLPHQSG